MEASSSRINPSCDSDNFRNSVTTSSTTSSTRRHSSNMQLQAVKKISCTRSACNKFSNSFFIVFIWISVINIIPSFQLVNACNIDTSAPIRYKGLDYSGNDGDYFGYTVLQHKTKQKSFVLIGAPKGNSIHQTGLRSPGIVYSCKTVPDYSCSQLNLDSEDNEVLAGRLDNKDGQWLGVSMTRQTMTGGDLSACGHRYTNNFFVGNGVTDVEDRYINGICYTFNLNNAGEVETTARKFPCLDGDQWSGTTRVNSWCQAGMGVAFTGHETNYHILYGAPGYYNWTGTVILERESDVFRESRLDPTEDAEYSYSGYSVAAGRFAGADNAWHGVAGAPRANELGMVTVYDLNDNAIFQKLVGEPLNTYFGGAVAVVDFNSDGYSDLVVGAPLHSTDQDEGKVYIYLNTGSPNPQLRLVQEVQGSKAFRARFGTSLFGCGDLDKDGYQDIIVGAPYENDGIGAVYIYRGTSQGINPVYSQRIAGSDFTPAADTFGISVYGGLDMDGNGNSDIAVGAYGNETAFLFRTKPVILIEAWLELSPSSIDPDNKDVEDCVLDGIQKVCLTVTVCFRFSGITVTKNTDIEYKIIVDEEKEKQGFTSRFGLTGAFLSVIQSDVGMFHDTKTCEPPIKAYLQDNARDFLTTVPIKLEYNIIKYAIEEETRGDNPFHFPSGLPPVNNNFNCEAETITEEVRFVQNCGSDGICQTDIQLTASVELPGGKTNELILGAATTLYVIARIDNLGEEAHQAVLNVYHPSDLGYEGVELEQVHCLPEATEQGVVCVPEVVTTCSPQLAAGTSVVAVDCSIGNPMNAYNSATLRLRFDASDIPWSVNRMINITMVVSTVSIESDNQKANNMDQLKFSVIVEADLGVVGVSQPESIYYGYNGTSLGYKDQATADKAKLEAALAAQALFYEYNYDETRYNETWIGPAFKHEFQVINYGPGRLPLTSDVVIHIPWRTMDGDWLIFIRSITINNQKGSCNESPILLSQKKKIEELYGSSSSEFTLTDEENSETLATEDNPRQLGCGKAICVDVSCSIERLENDETVKIVIDSLLWEYTFVTREYGFVEIVSEATVTPNDPNSIVHRPEDDKPDTKKLQIVAYTATMGQEPIAWWIILVAVLIGILLLIAAVVLLWKFGFFKREMKNAMADSAGGPDFEQLPTEDS